MSKEVFLAISGMSCVNCARSIERALAELDGVKRVRVFFADESAEVEYVEEKINPQVILREIAKCGYSGRILGTETENSPDWLSLIFTTVFALPTALLAMWAAPTYPNKISQMILSGIILMTTGKRFFTGAIRAIKNSVLNMDVLVALGAGTSWLYSAATMIFPSLTTDGMLHFETSALLILFLLFGKTLEARARHAASKSLRELSSLQQGTVRRIKQTSDGKFETEIVAPTDIKTGDIIKVLPGERFLVDGRVEEGESATDESLLTGESMPVPKKKGVEVISGTMNLSGELVIKVKRAVADSRLSALIRVVRRAQADRPEIQRFADEASAWFVPGIIVLSVLTFVGWIISGHSLNIALMHSVTVLVIACPCALGLATPMAIIVSAGVALKHGLLVKKTSALEALATVKYFLMDKTGTLTNGKPEVEYCEILESSRKDITLCVARSLAQRSIHPLSQALTLFLSDYETQDLKWTSFEERRGYGISAVDANNQLWILGNHSLMQEKGINFPPLPQLFIEKALTPVYLANNKTPAAIFGLSDTPRVEAAETVRKLKDLGIHVVMVSGDKRPPVEAISKAVGIDEYYYEKLPEEKLQILREFLKRGRTAFVGDGINDAPALSAATVGIALSSGSDLAQESTDLVIMSKDLRLLAFAVEISRRTLSKIKQNLVWAVIYNVLALPLAAGLLVPVLGHEYTVTPAIAGLAMAFSSLSVVLNSLLLNRLN